MKSLVFLFFLSFSVVNASAQYLKLVVQLKDKSSTTYTLSNPSQYLSQRAIDRRIRYSIAIDSTDLPVSDAYVDSLRLAGNVTILSKSKWLNQVLIETTDQSAITRIMSFPFVRSAKGVGNRIANNRHDVSGKFPKPANMSRTAGITGTTKDTFDYGASYNQIHLHEGEYLHNKGFHGETMQIAILDAGFFQYRTNTAFDSIRMNGQVLGERDFVAFDNSVNEDDSHGAFCLSILSANWPGKMVGTAPKASYWLIRTENAASEYPVEEHNWVVGAEFADSCGVDLISSSLGYNTFDDASFNHSYADFYKDATTISRGASAAVNKGMIVTNSAGNEGNNNWKYLIFPADDDSVCAVGAVNAAGTIATFSSFGYNGKLKPNIVSLGQGTVIAGLNNEPATGSGTSFSNPNIAGLIACLWQAFPKSNNMKILKAVYQSADRYTIPDERYGYGIPNFRIAYQLLKHDENVALYGNEFLFASPNPFTAAIDTKLIGQVDGKANLTLLNSAGQLVASNDFSTEKEETYIYTFAGLSNLPAGNYLLKYADSLHTKTIALKKDFVVDKDWLVAVPNPFAQNLMVYLKAPETGEIHLRLTDAKGSVVETITAQTIQNETQSFRFNNSSRLAHGNYFLEYISKSQKRSIRLVK